MIFVLQFKLNHGAPTYWFTRAEETNSTPPYSSHSYHNETGRPDILLRLWGTFEFKNEFPQYHICLTTLWCERINEWDTRRKWKEVPIATVEQEGSE